MVGDGDGDGDGGWCWWLVLAVRIGWWLCLWQPPFGRVVGYARCEQMRDICLFDIFRAF